MSWRNLNIRKKIMICFAVPVVLLMVIGFWTFQSGGNILKNAQHMQKKSIFFAGVAHQMQKDVIQMQQWLTDISATRGLDGLNDGFDEAEKSYMSFLQGLDRFENMFKEENDSEAVKRSQRLRILVNDYYVSGKKMASAYIEGGPATGNKMMADFDSASEGLSLALTPFIKEQTDEVNTMTDEIITLIDDLKRGVVFICILSLLAVMLISLLLSRSFKNALYAARDLAHAMSEGDLTREVSFQTEDEFGQLLNAERSMIEKLKSIVLQISGVSSTIASSSEELSATTTQINAGIEDQSQQLEQSATAASEVSQTIIDVAKNATEASSATNDSLGIANDGKVVVEQSVKSMLTIAENMEVSSRTVEELGESSKKIGEIIDVINDIAGQTNLLALNAAIEAARAGEQGRGFAVVADEVRKLAEKTSEVTEEITGMIEKIQKDTDLAVNSMGKNKSEVDEGVRLAEKSRESLDQIVDASQKSMDMVNSIATATEQQSSAVEEVSASMESIAGAFASSRDAVQQITMTTDEFSRTASELVHLLSWFRTEGSSHAVYGTEQGQAESSETVSLH